MHLFILFPALLPFLLPPSPLSPSIPPSARRVVPEPMLESMWALSGQFRAGKGCDSCCVLSCFQVASELRSRVQRLYVDALQQVDAALTHLCSDFSPTRYFKVSEKHRRAGVRHGGLDLPLSSFPASTPPCPALHLHCPALPNALAQILEGYMLQGTQGRHLGEKVIQCFRDAVHDSMSKVLRSLLVTKPTQRCAHKR